MVDLGKGKNERVLSIYTELQNGYLVSKAEAAKRFGVDDLPTAKILKEDENGYLVEAEVFGDGIDMWMKGQGESIKVV